MRKIALLAAAALLAVAAAPGHAAPKPVRVEEKRYEAGTTGGQNVGAACVHPSMSWDACYLEFYAQAGEHSFRVEVFDDVSPEPMIRVYQDTDGNGMSDKWTDVCGESARIRTKPYQKLAILVWGHPGSDPYGHGDEPCHGVSTSGTIRVSFFR